MSSEDENTIRRRLAAKESLADAYPSAVDVLVQALTAADKALALQSAEIIIRNVEIMMPARTVHLHLINQSDRTMVFVDKGRESGMWTETESPPDRVGPNEHKICRIESDGVWTGAIGWVLYRLDGVEGTMRFFVSSPYGGSTSCEYTEPSNMAGYQGDLSITNENNAKAHAVVRRG